VKIAQNTPDLLVLAESAAPIRSIGAIIVLVGSAFLYAAQMSHAGFGAWVAATVSIPIGLAMIILPGRVTAAFDRASHTLIVTRRGIRATTRDEIDFSKIASVEAERSTISEGQPTFRVTIVLRDGYRLPLTNWYASGASYPVAAAAAAKFLGLAAPADAPAAAPIATARAALAAALTAAVEARGGTSSVQARRRTGSRYAVVLAAIFFAAFIGIGGWLEYVQYSRLATYRPASAVVLTSTTTSHRGSKGGTTWSPAVSYRYAVNEHEYVGTQVTPINESRSGQWAFKIAARYRPGQATTAWYDPDRPDQAFLLHEASWLPLMFIGMPLGMLGIILIISRLRAAKRLTPIFAPAGRS
jgi:hypothetical protein